MSSVYLGGRSESTRKLKVLISNELGIRDKSYVSLPELKNTDVIFAGKGSVLSVMLELLKIAQVPINRYSIDFLDTAYRNYDGNKKGFDCAKLFSEGWLCCNIGEWDFSFSRIDIHRDLKNIESEKDRQIISFLRELAKIPYKDEQCLILDPYADSFRNLLSEYGFDIADLERLGILRELSSADKGICPSAGQETAFRYGINTNARIWETYGPLVVARYLEETKENHENAVSISDWLSVISCMYNCRHPETYLTSMTEAVINECLARLEKEGRTWADEIHCMEKSMAVSCGSVSYDDFHLPEERIERLQRLIQLKEYWDLPWSENLEDRMFGICCRSYEIMTESQKDRFTTLLTKPHFYIRFFCGEEHNLNCAVDCLNKSELCFEAASLLANRIVYPDHREWSEAFPEFDSMYRKKIGGLLGKVLGDNLLRDRIGSERIDHLRDILIYYSDQARVYFRNNSVRANPVYGELFRALFQSLMEEGKTAERLCHDLPPSLCRMIHEGSRPLSVCALGILGDLINESAFRKRCEKKEKLEAFRGLLLFMNRFLAGEDLLAFCDWDIFLPDRWAEILQCDTDNKEKLDNIWDQLIGEENRTFPKEEQWSRTFEYRELAVICLVLKQVIYKGDPEKELKWIDDFFDQHKKLQLFEGENLREMGYGTLLQYYLAGVSAYSPDGKRRFCNMLSSSDAVDCIFWYSYINDDQLRKRCHELISDIRFEELTKDLVFLQSYVLAGDQLFEILFKLKEETAEGKAEEEDYDRLKETLERLLEFLKEVIQKRAGREREFGTWVKHAEERLLILEGKHNELLENTGTTPFYRGLALLECGDINGLEEAEKIFRDYHTQGNLNGTMNLLFCLCSIIELRIKSAESFEKELEETEVLAARIQEDKLLDTRYKKDAFCFQLRLFSNPGMKARFKKLYYEMPEEYRGDKACGTLILKAAEQYGDNGIYEEEKKLLAAKHGRSFIEKINLISPEPNFILLNDVSLQTLRNAINSIPHLPLDQSADVLNQWISGDLCKGLSGDSQISDKEAAHVLKMVLRTAVSLKEMSRCLLHNQKAAHEDTYNENFSRLFNVRYEETAGFYIKDQSQGGITGSCSKRGESGTGRRDMIVMHDGYSIMLLEGIRMESMNTSALKEHINRLPQYDDSNMLFTAVIVYVSVKDMKEFRDKYFAFLEALRMPENYSEASCIETKDMDQVVTWSNIGIKNTPDAVFRTIHRFPGEVREKVVFHILIDVNRLGTIKGSEGT